LVVNNGSNTWFSSSGVIPHTVSVTLIRT